jgi:hypothetical protein
VRFVALVSFEACIRIAARAPPLPPDRCPAQAQAAHEALAADESTAAEREVWHGVKGLLGLACSACCAVPRHASAAGWGAPFSWRVGFPGAEQPPPPPNPGALPRHPTGHGCAWGRPRSGAARRRQRPRHRGAAVAGCGTPGVAGGWRGCGACQRVFQGFAEGRASAKCFGMPPGVQLHRRQATSRSCRVSQLWQEALRFEELRRTADALGEGDEAAELIRESYRGVRGGTGSSTSWNVQQQKAHAFLPVSGLALQCLTACPGYPARPPALHVAQPDTRSRHTPIGALPPGLPSQRNTPLPAARPGGGGAGHGGPCRPHAAPGEWPLTQRLARLGWSADSE